MEFDCDIPDEFTYSVKDIRQSAYSVPFTSTNVKLTYTGVITDNRGAEPISTEETFTVDIPFEPNDSDVVNNVISDALDFHGVEVPYQITSLCKQKTPFYLYNPGDSDVTVGVLKNNANAYTSAPEYSVDGQNWTQLGNTATTPKTFIVKPKSYVMVRQTKNDSKWSDANSYNYFTSDGEIHIGGNITSLTWPNFEEKKTTKLDKNYAYYGCFTNMVHLTDASELILDYVNPSSPTACANTFAQMFNGCSSLVAAPKLNATTLTNNMCAGMFKDCTSLTETPYLPAEHLVNGCYFNMFNGCSSLQKVNANFIDEPSTAYTNNWLQGVPDHGTFIKNPNATWDVVGNSGIPVGWTMQNSDDSALYTFGVLSDWHYGSADGDRTTNQATFVKPEVISTFYKDQDVDFMTLDGDLTYNGKVTELTNFKIMVADQFGDIPFYYNQGNHDAVCTDANYESTTGVKKNFVEIKGQDVFIFASQDYTSSIISDDTSDVAYKNSVNWILATLEKYKGFRIFLYIHYCFYGMAGAAPGVSYGFTNGSTIAKSIVDKVKEVGNTIIFTGHTHFDMSRDQSNDKYTHTQSLGNNTWMVHIPSCGWCKTGDGKGEANCIKDLYPEDTTYGKIYRSQGYVAEAYPDKVILKAYQFNTDEWLTDYVFDVSGITNIVGASLIGEESKDPVVPEGEEYITLDSVYTNSAHWQTDYIVNKTDTLEWKGTLTKTSQYLMGSADDSSLKRFDIQYNSKNVAQFTLGAGTKNESSALNLLDGVPHTFTFGVSAFVVDGKDIKRPCSGTFTQPTAPIRICSIAGDAYGADTAHLYIGRFYEASVYDSDGTLKKHWVPVYTKDGVYKLHETVGDTFIEPSSSGEIRWED